MYFSDIINAAISKDNDRPLMQKELYAVGENLQQYLVKYKRDIALPVSYTALFHYSHTNSIKDARGKPTHWENVVYEPAQLQQLKPGLLEIYQRLNPHNQTDADIKAIDFCEYANSMPFRISVVGKLDKGTDFFYLKSADASRIYGLELEQLLTDNSINFLYHQQTLAESHIEGIPGDIFLKQQPEPKAGRQKILAAEFVRFNESCFTRLLGDMRSYNFVVIESGDGQSPGFRIKAIDFDQQCYEGRMNLYLPQFYKENYDYVKLVHELLSDQEIEQIRLSEKIKMAALAVKSHRRLQALLSAMAGEELSENFKILSLKKELGKNFHTHRFANCKTMGCLVKQQLKQQLQQHLNNTNF